MRESAIAEHWLLAEQPMVEKFVQALAPSGSISKGGDPAAGSPTATLLQLHPSH